MRNIVCLALLVVACGAPRGGSTYGGSNGGAAESEPVPEEAGAAETPSESTAKTACKPDGEEVSHYSECCSNDAYVEDIQDPVNGAWHSGRRLCGKKP